MPKFERQVNNPDGTISMITVEYSSEGVKLMKRTLPQATTEVTIYTILEWETIYDLTTLAHPLYKAGESN